MATDHQPSSPSPRPGAITRAVRALRWLAPGVGLALIPKCPACLAAYLALGTGMAVSLQAAEALRIALFVICGGTLAALIFRKARRPCRRSAPDG
jgi:hypothetical protein